MSEKIIRVIAIVQATINCVLAVLCTLTAFVVGALGGPILELVIGAILNFMSFWLQIFIIKRLS